MKVTSEHAQHLVDSIKSFYTATTDWSGSLYCGLAIDEIVSKFNLWFETQDLVCVKSLMGESPLRCEFCLFFNYIEYIPAYGHRITCLCVTQTVENDT